jgi:hypothetical protein
MLKASQKRMKRAAFSAGVDVEHAGQHGGWLATMPTSAAEVREAAEDVAGVVRLHLVELAVVHHAPEHVVHVVRLVGVVGDDVEQLVVARSRGSSPRRAAASSTLFSG